eukprot:COSAG05_NODE_9276_length_635_cov_1.000000_2_plen_68_part_01
MVARVGDCSPRDCERGSPAPSAPSSVPPSVRGVVGAAALLPSPAKKFLYPCNKLRALNPIYMYVKSPS